ncbi:MAG: arylesterase [Immundisolibacteraceae bacterium]|nr:arylesterase [Immundisolibacteraceae bacterium]
MIKFFNGLLLLLWMGHANAEFEDPAIVVLGDSLSAGYQLPADHAWPALLELELREQKFKFKVINAGISGDTTAGGLARLPQLLSKYHPHCLIVELGANDGLRGLSLQQAERNLADIIEQGLASGSRVLLVGMQIPTNFGPRYSNYFQQMYPRLSQRYSISLMPFLFASLDENPNLFLADMLHPNSLGQQLLMKDVLASLKQHDLLIPARTRYGIKESQ